MRPSEMARLKAKLAQRGITVTPKHTTLRAEIRRLLGSDICADCGLAVVEHSGKLVDGLYCGRCAGVRALAQEGINAA